MSTVSFPAGRFALTLVGHSAPGQVAAVAAFTARHGAYVEEFSVFDDKPTSRFFLRAVFRCERPHAGLLDDLHADMREVAQQAHVIEWRLSNLQQPTRVLLMVSRLDHCLLDLLSAWRRGEMPMKPVAIVSNHPDLASVAEAHGLPYHHLPVTHESKPEQEAKLLDLVARYDAELVVLARYMQVLSDEFCRRLPGRIINIHHSFLPGFKGARPYHQAYERGVKLIGATAHFATPDLDEGPIIEQATERVDHAHSPEDLLNVGRQMECSVLSRALRTVLEHRVFINGQRTVVLR